MTTVEEIENAIEKLTPADIRRVAKWLDEHQVRSERIKHDAIRATSGCLTEEEGEDFAKAVEEAGNGPMEDHVW